LLPLPVTEKPAIMMSLAGSDCDCGRETLMSRPLASPPVS
jgi:hypothetical protein